MKLNEIKNSVVVFKFISASYLSSTEDKRLR